MNYIKFGVYLIFMFTYFAITGCSPPAYTAEELAKRQAKFIEGVVSKQSRGSFILEEGNGEENLYRTGQITQYIPENYRSQKGDTVKLAYTETLLPTGQSKRAVLQLESIHIPPQNRQLPNPIEGELVHIARGSSKHPRSLMIKHSSQDLPVGIYIPYGIKPILVNGKAIPDVEVAWQDAIGSQASIVARRIPILRGNDYLYEAEEITLQKQ